jgi:D-serine dehydratase
MDTVESSSAPEAESRLVQHAREELQRAGLFDIDGDYGGMVGASILEMVKLFASQGHSGGFSAQLSIDVLSRLLRFQPLTPITSDAEEWMEVDDGLWQNRRAGTLF